MNCRFPLFRLELFLEIIVDFESLESGIRVGLLEILQEKMSIYKGIILLIW